jgi:cytochrome c
MKKLFILFAACNFIFLTNCGSKKQAGEEYYDPDYKAQTDQASTQTAENNSGATTEPSTGTAATGTTTTGTDAATTTTGTDAGTATTTESTGAIGNAGAPAAAKKPAADKDDATVAVVAKDKLKPSPSGKNYDVGKNLINKSDCLACHKDDVKLLGPAYVDVAKKYEPTAKNITYLVGKIKKGGAGVWGDIPMSPHPDLPDNDVREMVEYILSLRK